MHLRPVTVAAIAAGASLFALVRVLHPAPSAPLPPPLAFTSPAASRFVHGDDEPSAAYSPHRRRAYGVAAANAMTSLVYVVGAVVRPGLYPLPRNGRVADAVHSAGGMTATADPEAVNLAAPARDGEEIIVPARGQRSQAAEAPANPTASPRRRHRRPRHKRRAAKVAVPSEEAAGSSDGAAPQEPARRIDINQADEATLESLPGIGPALAARIVAFRGASGPFSSVDELLDVAGMTEAKVDRLSPQIIVP